MTQYDYPPPPPPPYGQPYYGPLYPPVAQPRNGMGTAGMVLGIVGLVLGWLPMIGWLAFVLALVGLPLSGVGYSRTKRGEATNRGPAIAGIVCNIITLVVCVLGFIVMVAFATSGY